MRPRLPPKAAERLAKVAGLLASDQPGEVVSAAGIATRLLGEHGITWERVFLDRGEPAPAAAPPPPPNEAPSDWRGVVRFCLFRRRHLTPWEVGFLGGLQSRARLSPKQATTLRGIVTRLQVVEAGA